VLTRLHSTLALRERQFPRAATERPRPVPLYSVVKNGSKAAPYLGGTEYDKWYSGKVKAAASAQLREEITYRQFAAK
jgi:hypothetical protein